MTEVNYTEKEREVRYFRTYTYRDRELLHFYMYSRPAKRDFTGEPPDRNSRKTNDYLCPTF